MSCFGFENGNFLQFFINENALMAQVGSKPDKYLALIDGSHDGAPTKTTGKGLNLPKLGC
jgi:hypothetical protein